MKTGSCKKCQKNYNSLTEKSYCCFCHREIYGRWPQEFIAGKDSLRHMGGLKKNRGKAFKSNE